ncbi:hypothetical protein PR048_031410 [Dryococelus australis]|uniref:VLRF1 domain-containing protein n=1 Tax=Dryococelus australis TaxID=614101 RepID=A0ABQ9G568_9NEOP|nr:hypothetical protein PR048_031410 [Dryococelus australis]
MDYKTYKIYDGENFEDLTRGIKVAKCMKSPESNISEEDTTKILAKLEDLSVSEKLFCSFCNASFEDQSQQRPHYKLDWHRYNLKQNLLGRKHVTEENFMQLADDVSSISGSESDTETEGEMADSSSSLGQSASASRQLKKKGKKIDSSSSSSDEENEKSSVIKQHTYSHPSRHPKVFFENEDGKIFSLYRCLLHGKKNFQDKDEALVSLALQRSKNSIWLIIMLGGGHFAAAVFQGSLVLTHKTFHSYTVRASQGGSQSSRDARSRGTHPKSAGASLRRYNEMALAQHVQDMMELWSPHIGQCELIFHRAVGHNRNVLFGGRNPLLNKADPRLRTIPFPTRRATFSEVKRIHDVLSTLEVYGYAVYFPVAFPQSPRRKPSKTLSATDAGTETESTYKGAEMLNGSNPVEGCQTAADVKPVEKDQGKGEKKSSPRNRQIDRAKPRKSPHRPLPGIVMRLAVSSSESDIMDGDMIVDNNFLVHCDAEISFGDCLQEFEDTVPQAVKDRRRNIKKYGKKKKKPNSKNSDKEAEPSDVSRVKKALSTACTLGDVDLLTSTLLSLQQGANVGSDVQFVPEPLERVAPPMTSEEVLKYLNTPIADSGNTVLHIAAHCGHCNMVRKLLELGSDPGNRNLKNQPPYVIAVNKETRNVFRRFMGEFPEKYDYKKVRIIFVSV